MKTQNISKKLTLSKVTVSTLSASEIRNIEGGKTVERSFTSCMFDECYMLCDTEGCLRPY